MLLLSPGMALFAALFLAGGGNSPLLRFWAGIFLLGALVLEFAGREMAAGAVLPAREERIAWLCAGIAGLCILPAMSFAAIRVSGSAWNGLIGLLAMGSAAVQVTAYDAAKTRYLKGAGAAISGQHESIFEISMLRREAELRGRKKEAFMWRYYELFRRAQQSLIPPRPAGSAEQFWKLNRNRMRGWALLSPNMILSYAATAAIVSAFRADTLVALLWLIAGAGNLLLLLLLAIGWKIRPVNG